MIQNFPGSMIRPIAGFLFALAAYGQAGNPQEAVTNLIRMHNAWGPNASTPGTSIAFQAAGRDGQTLKYHLRAKGLSKDKQYTLVSWPVTQKAPTQLLGGVTLDPTGLAICAGTPGTCGNSAKPNNPIDLTLHTVPGEPARFGLVAVDNSTKTFGKFVPVPLRGTASGCTAEAFLLTPGAELVIVEGSGFPVNSEIAMDSDSEGEIHSQKAKTDANGRYQGAMLPYKQGVARGTVKVVLKSAKCSPAVEVPWGARK